MLLVIIAVVERTEAKVNSSAYLQFDVCNGLQIGVYLLCSILIY
jgi:hypothetical protein